MIIVHRCVRCNHPDYYNLNSPREGSIIHSGRQDGMTISDFRLIRRRCNTPECAPACQNFCEWGPPELMVCFRDGAFGERTTDLVPPGSLAWGAEHGLAKQYSCACDDCQALYVHLLPLAGTKELLSMAEPTVNTMREHPLAPPVTPPPAAAEPTEHAPVIVLDGQGALFDG